MSEYNTALIKYIYLDVVGFTHNRPVEAQTDIISALNNMVRQSVSCKIAEEQVIYIPVGDGICTCIIGNTTNYDDHILIAQDIIRRIVSIHNPSVTSNRRFEVRIGINENIDNIITDIKDEKNVCGAGVNLAQRIMSFADASQILIGRTTYDSLKPREKYSNAFRSYISTTKHNVSIELYQYTGGNVSALNRNPPSFFTTEEKKLSRLAAYYLAHAIKNRGFIDSHLLSGTKVWALGVLLSYLAEDSLGYYNSSRVYTYDPHMPQTSNNTLEEQFVLFSELPFWVCCDLYDARVGNTVIHNYNKCFENDSYGLFVSAEGEQKLKSEWETIWHEFGLDNFAIH